MESSIAKAQSAVVFRLPSDCTHSQPSHISPSLEQAPLGYADSRTSSPPAPTVLVVSPWLEATAQQEDRRFTPSLWHSRIGAACEDAG